VKCLYIPSIARSMISQADTHVYQQLLPTTKQQTILVIPTRHNHNSKPNKSVERFPLKIPLSFRQRSFLSCDKLMYLSDNINVSHLRKKNLKKLTNITSSHGSSWFLAACGPRRWRLGPCTPWPRLQSLDSIATPPQPSPVGDNGQRRSKRSCPYLWTNFIIW
jgi:hypothetical protein